MNVKKTAFQGKVRLFEECQDLGLYNVFEWKYKDSTQGDEYGTQ